jgi:histidine ammonia-lyase
MGAMMPAIRLGAARLTGETVVAVARQGASVTLAPEAVARVQAARELVRTIAEEDRVVYGVTTGFGHLSQVRIGHAQLADLQRNLLRSHASGVGEPLPEDVTRAMLLLLANSLARGHSGVRVEVIEALLGLLNARVWPVIPSRGSVGASGDLAPLAHLGLMLIGEGEAIYEGQRQSSADVLRQIGLGPLELQPKEGLALINGTHLMEALGVLTLYDARAVFDSAVTAAAMSVEALMGSFVPFDARIHALRPQSGQVAVAAHLRELLAESEINPSHKDCPRVQDPYTLRCIPQVLGAVRDALDYCAGVFERELLAVTDNPLLFPEQGESLSGGNFHGQPLALALDMLAIAVAQLAGFSERRAFSLVEPHEWDTHTHAFLTPDPGLNSGYMIPQYVAAALVNEIKLLAHPASIDSLPTSAGMEDWNSMGATSALKARQAVTLAARVVAIELLCAAQLLEFRQPLKPGKGVQAAYAQVRALVPALTADRPPAPDIERLAELVLAGLERAAW